MGGYDVRLSVTALFLLSPNLIVFVPHLQQRPSANPALWDVRQSRKCLLTGPGFGFLKVHATLRAPDSIPQRSLLPANIASRSHSLAAVPARCTFKAANYSSCCPRAPPTGTQTWDRTASAGGRLERAAEVKLDKLSRYFS